MQELTIDATLDNVAVATQFVEDQLTAADCPTKPRMQVCIAIDELFSNIARYAYDPEVGPATLRVEIAQDPLAVIVTFIDHGVPYDPLAAADPDTSLPVDERSIGGLGVFMVKKSMDSVDYAYENGHNILRIRKEL